MIETPVAVGNPPTDARKVYILPTRFGLLFAAALLLMLLVSVNYNNGLGHLFTFLLGGVGMVAMHYTQRNLLDLSIAVDSGRPVFLGQQARVRVRVADGARRRRNAIVIRGGEDQALVDVAAGEAECAWLRFTPSRRGRVALPEVYCVSVFPLGLFCAWTRRVGSSSTQLVYPRPAPPTRFPESGEGEAGENTTRRPGDDDFRGVRDHRQGDSPGRIHWRNSARGAGLKTKQFGGSGGGSTDFDWNDTSGDDETRLSLLCRWLVDADAAGRTYGLLLPGTRIAPGRGPDHLHACLRALALWSG
jgi:uncharacterized protein (DUF58 family)